ncbi:gdsl esterase/lipase 2 [Quercus suber]|uniref:Gdsl esterase/lipase 2 n=1 Tax=Quercus suber TaxID=58331 RepID=A0AAW0LU14_QUESU
MMSLRFYFYILVLYASITIRTQCRDEICLPKDHVAFFIFGDSVVDDGNNNYINTTTGFQSNFAPYGETFFRYPTGRSSNGRLITDFIAEYAKLPLIPPYLHPGYERFIDGANFASIGAGALDETNHGMVISLNAQLNYFNNLETTEARTSIGGNDYFVPFASDSSMQFLQSYSKQDYVNMVIGNLTTVIKEIYKKGGRKYVFHGLGPAGSYPLFKAMVNTSACLEELTTLVKLHNKALSEVLKLESELKGFKYSIVDVYTFVSERIDNPSKYEGKIACCGTGPYRGILSCGNRSVSSKYELCTNTVTLVIMCSSFRKGQRTTHRANLEWNSQCLRILQSQSIV